MSLERLVEFERYLRTNDFEDWNMTKWSSCALGCAARNPVFNEQGFTKVDSCFYLNDQPAAPVRIAERFFGLTDQETYNLFSPCEYGPEHSYYSIPKQAVCERLLEIIKKKAASCTEKD